MRNRKKASSELVKKVLTKACNRLNRKIHEQIKDHDDRQVEKLADDICNAEPNRMWHLFNRYKSRNKTIDEPETPLKTPNGSLATDKQQKCNEFARYLNSVHQTPENPLFDMEFKRQIDREVERKAREVDTNTMKLIHLPQFNKILSETKKNSAPGEDSVSYDLIKCCSDSTKQVFCDLINECVKQNVFPNAWKEAKVKMLPKPGRDKNFAANYRPISLLSALGKIFERYIYAYLYKELEQKKFFNKNQAGFVKGRCPQEHLFRLAQGMSNGFKERKCTLALFVDVKAAFDAVWRNGLKFKIDRIGLSKQVANLLHSFLDNRTLKVNVDDAWSDIVHLRAGAPQGSVLSPLLYLIFVNDLTDSINLSTVTGSQFADDVGLWLTRNQATKAKMDMQCEVTKLEQWCQKWQVTLNPAKSKLVLFTKCPRHKEEVDANGLTIQLFKEQIATVDEADYLGVTFDARMTWEPQTRKMISRSYQRLNLIRIISSISNKPKPENLLMLLMLLL